MKMTEMTTNIMTRTQATAMPIPIPSWLLLEFAALRFSAARLGITLASSSRRAAETINEQQN